MSEDKHHNIIINVNSEWLFNNLMPDEDQIFVFEGNQCMKLITVFEGIGISEKKWTPTVGPSAKLEEHVYSWKVTEKFKSIIQVYHCSVDRMNITVDYVNNTLALDSHSVGPHGFRWKISNIDLDGETSWKLEDMTVAAECSFDWRDLTLVLEAARFSHVVTIKVNSNNNDVLWEGFEEDGTKCWAHQHQRLAWKYGEATTKFQPDVLYNIMRTMDMPQSYSPNTKLSILKTKILMIESQDTIAYMAPIIDDVQIDGGLCMEDKAPPVEEVN